MRFSSVKYLSKEGFKNIWNNRIMSIASIGVMISCLLLTGAALLFSININNLLQGVESQNSIRIFLNMDVSTLDAVKIGQDIKKISNIGDCTFVSKEETVEEFSGFLGDGPLSEGLSGAGNPFPHVYNVSLIDLSLYDQTVTELKQIQGVDSITDFGEVASKLTRLNQLISSIGLTLIIILSAVSIFILSNTVKITMYSRRLEISIMKSVGATDWFIKIPFLVEAIVIGVVAAIGASVLLRIILDNIIQFFKNMMAFSQIEFSSVSFPIVCGFLVVGILLGAFSAMITIRKYLKNDTGGIINV